MRLGGLTHPAAKRALQDRAVALLPVGATEAHGPHLPLDTDVRIAEETCRRSLPLLAELLKVEGLILPPVAYSVTDYAAPFEGTIGVPAEPARNYLSAIMVSASRQGFRAVCAVNAHLEPAHRHVLRDAAKAAQAEAACPVVIADPGDRRWVRRLTEEFQSGKCHAGQYETSLILALDAPVDRSLVSQLPSVDIDLMEGMRLGKRTFLEMGADSAYFGTPAQATAREGHDTYGRLATIVFEVLRTALDSPEAEESTEPEASP